MTWLRSWRGERFVVSSTLSMDDAHARLEDGLAGHWGTLGATFGPSGVVRGNVRHNTVELVAMHAGLGAWQPVLRGRLVASDTGCQLELRRGWNESSRLLSALWLGGALLGFLFGLVAAMYRMVTGHVEAAGGPAAVAGVAMALALIFVGLTTITRWLSRDQVSLLHSWLAERLQQQG